MKRKTLNVLRVVGAVVLSLLLLYWLFVATDLNEDVNDDYEIVQPAAVE